MNFGVTRKVAMANDLIREHRFSHLGQALRSTAWSDVREYGFRRDLTVPFPAPDALIPIEIRMVEPDDVRGWFDVNAPGITDEERWDRTSRLHLLDAGFSTCFAAVTSDGQPCFIQWLIYPWENDLSQRVFGGWFPRLAPSEVLLEGAFTIGAFRGQKIMPAAMARVAEHAAGLGAHYAITFVGDGNVPSIKGCMRAGFSPYTERTVSHRLGTLRIRSSPLPAGVSIPS